MYDNLVVDLVNSYKYLLLAVCVRYEFLNKRLMLLQNEPFKTTEEASKFQIQT